MGIRCAIGGHRTADDGVVYNSGFYFSPCRRCGRTLIRSARSEWATVPPGHRVVWKPGRHSHSLEADFTGVLPVMGEAATLPAAPGPFVSWSRALLAQRPGGRKAAAAVAEEGDEIRCPRLLLLAVLVGAGLRMLLSLGAER